MASYVSYRYEKEWYVGMVEEVLVEENDVLVKFLHPKGPSMEPQWSRFIIGPQLRINAGC